MGRAIGYVIGFRGGRPLLERSGKTQKFRQKNIDKGEKLFERFTWLGVVAALWLVPGIKKMPVPIEATDDATLQRLESCLGPVGESRGG